MPFSGEACVEVSSTPSVLDSNYKVVFAFLKNVGDLSLVKVEQTVLPVGSYAFAVVSVNFCTVEVYVDSVVICAVPYEVVALLAVARSSTVNVL